MDLQADAFRWMEDSGGTWLCLRTTRREAMQVCEGAKPDTAHNVKITQERKKRSLDANAYAWVLIDKLAAKLSTPKAPVTPTDVYRSYIKDVADNNIIVPVKEGMLEHWDRVWCAGHIGRMTEDLGPCRLEELKGYRNVKSYMGSSDYDTAQMSRLIDLIVEDAKAQGIETWSDEKLSALCDSWGRVQDA